jgi:hypothetical protein
MPYQGTWSHSNQITMLSIHEKTCFERSTILRAPFYSFFVPLSFSNFILPRFGKCSFPPSIRVWGGGVEWKPHKSIHLHSSPSGLLN